MYLIHQIIFELHRSNYFRLRKISYARASQTIETSQEVSQQ